ncbi:ABC transporter sulfate transport ATP-binding protein isoform 1 [Gracilaria domingensis]|nr:ABC transporter sulfate transport ATP-binding protein isoform 1 [Gracilaria domingensis]
MTANSPRVNTTAPPITPPASPSRSIISSLKHVSYDVAGVRVVEDVSLDIAEGEIVCILGPSGSGKSTILRMLAGLTRPSEGVALYKGRPFRGPNPGASIVFQTFALYPWLTVLENVELGLSNASGVTREVIRERSIRAIDIIGLDGYENAYPRELSGGMRQRVGFARALAVEPEILCMDEPFSALDVLTAENLRSELLRLWQAGDVPTTSVLIVTHGIEEAVSLADRVVILGKDPGHVRNILPINLAHPRDRKSAVFQEITDLVYTILSEKDYVVSQEDIAVLSRGGYSRYTPGKHVLLSPQSVINSTPAPLSSGTVDVMDPRRSRSFDVNEEVVHKEEPSSRYPQLPAVRIGSVTGLLSFIAEDSEDLFRLGQRLQLDVDDLYPLIEAASILGFIEVDEGDVRMNATGHLFVRASIDERKHMIRMGALSAPEARLVAQIHCLLSQSAKQELPEDLIFDTILLKHFSPVKARKQLDIAIEWGRYAELFGYESLTGTLFLDKGDEVS